MCTNDVSLTHLNGFSLRVQSDIFSSFKFTIRIQPLKSL